MKADPNSIQLSATQQPPDPHENAGHSSTTQNDVLKLQVSVGNSLAVKISDTASHLPAIAGMRSLDLEFLLRRNLLRQSSCFPKGDFLAGPTVRTGSARIDSCRRKRRRRRRNSTITSNEVGLSDPRQRKRQG